MSIDWEEEIKKAREEVSDAEKQFSPLWKYLKYLLAFFLIILIVSYFVFDPTVRDVIAGFFESSTVTGNDEFVHENHTIVFNQGTYGQLVDLFRNNQEHEFKACLLGEVAGSSYQVFEVYEPRVYSQNVYHVVSESCPGDTIIDLHSHPYQRCVASQTDLQSLEAMKKRRPDLLLAVMCTETRISFYG